MLLTGFLVLLLEPSVLLLSEEDKSQDYYTLNFHRD